jgi:hypothetical protein
MCILEKEREHIGSIWSRVTCLTLPLAATQSLERQALGDSRRPVAPNGSDWKQVTEANK